MACSLQHAGPAETARRTRSCGRDATWPGWHRAWTVRAGLPARAARRAAGSRRGRRGRPRPAVRPGPPAVRLGEIPTKRPGPPVDLRSSHRAPIWEKNVVVTEAFQERTCAQDREAFASATG